MTLVLPSRRAALMPGLWVHNALWRSAKAVPSLDLRFADSKSLVDTRTGQSLITFTRASSATFINSAGTLQTAAVDVPRFDYNPTTGESLGLLVEEQRTNLVLRSEEFDNASWNSSAGARTVTANNATAPDGTTTADKVTADGTNAVHFVSQNFTLTAQAYSLSVYAKKDTEEVFTLRAFSALGGARAVFNLTTGVVSSTSSSTASIGSLPGGWYRCTMVFTPLAATGGLGLYVGTEVANTGTGSLFLWGAQLEVGAFPTSYIPTTTAAVTRSADVASITGTNFSSWYRGDEGTIYSEYRDPGAGGNRSPYFVNDNTASNRIGFFISGTTTINHRVATSSVQTNPSSLSTTLSIRNRHAIAVAVGSAAAASNGTLSTGASPASMPSVDRLNIGTGPGGALDWINAPVARLTYWSQRLSNSTLQTITQ